jgi:hypothetical protein
MSRITYVPKKFRPESLRLIREANAICAQYQAQGFDLTVRQLYYQFVARGLLPANTQQQYDKIKGLVNDARLAGYIDWDYIVDRTRNLRALPHWNSPAEIVEAVSRQYRIEKWKDQPLRIEVWIEKDALVGVLDAVCPTLDVDYFSCRGYTSQSEIWGAAQRLRGYLNDGQRVVVLHLGDHDPSGIDMTRDIRERLQLFISRDWYWEHQGEDDLDFYFDEDDMSEWEAYEYDIWQHVNDHLRIPADDIQAVPPLIVSRIALNMPQVQQYQPPPNFAKTTDARFAGYAAQFGQQSWELDALDPATLAALITAAVESFRDPQAWEAAKAQEEEEKSVLKKASDRWADVTSFLNGEDAA